MKNMNFMLKGLMKATMMLALLLVGQSLVAQSISTQSSSYTQSTQTKSTFSTSADYMSLGDAINALRTEALALANQAAETGESSLRATFYSKAAMMIMQAGSVQAGLDASASALPMVYARYKATAINVTEAELFQDAIDLVSN